MKKPSKSAASPAPATPAVKKAASPAPSVASASAPKAAPAAKTPAVAKVDPVNPPPAAKPAAPAAKPAVAAAKPAAPAPKASTPGVASKAETPNVTAITANIDVGFGNALFIRGEGPGLSWNKGLPMKNSGADAWTISFPKATRPILFKFLINDETWSTGPDFSADPGASPSLSPTF